MLPSTFFMTIQLYLRLVQLALSSILVEDMS